MTATLEVQSGCTTQTGWTGGTSLNIGTIQNERVKIDTGAEPIPKPLGTAEETRIFNLLGQSETVTVSGWFVGDNSERENFIRNMKLVAKYHAALPGTNTTLTYKNTNSDDLDIQTGLDPSGAAVKYKVMDLSISKSTRDGVGVVLYNFRLLRSKNE